MKAFLIVCILLATIVLSPLSTCSARELAEKGGISRGTNNPNKPVFNCGRGKRYCIPGKPKPPPCTDPYKRDCAPAPKPPRRRCKDPYKRDCPPAPKP